MKKSFLLYNDNYEAIKDLPPEDKGILLDAIFTYSINNIVPDLPPVVKVAFKFIQQSMDRDFEKWERIRERNITNGKLGGRPKIKKPRKPSGLFGNPKNPVNVNVKEKENNIKEKENSINKILLLAFSETLGVQFKSLTAYQKNINYWLEVYSVEDVEKAIRNIPRHTFWKDKMRPSILFRQYDRQHNPVDYIGELLSLPEPKQIKLWNYYPKSLRVFPKCPSTPSLFLPGLRN